MGVKNLWDILESCKKTLPLHHLQNKRVCIDLSCWMVQLQSVNRSHCAMKDKLYLKGLFHRLRALIALNCNLIFVTVLRFLGSQVQSCNCRMSFSFIDGSIPALKVATYRRRLNPLSEIARDDDADSKKPSSLRRNKGSEFSCMINEAKLLGMALGIPCLDGVEEAEAQCALLNSESLCDGCFSADSDIFLFGARTVYRDICLGDGGHIICYEMADIEEKLGLGRNSLIALALLLGSDYSHGVHGFGPELACRAVKSIGYDVLLQRLASEGVSFLKKSKIAKKQVKVLKNQNKENCSNYGDKVNGSDCHSQTDEFIRVIDAYLKPNCHLADSKPVYRALALYPFQRTELQHICTQLFEWPPEKTDEYMLPKIAERELRKFANLRISSSELGAQLPLDKMPIKCPVSEIIKERKVQGKECFEVSWDEIDGLKTSIVPADLVRSACPEKILEFEEKRAEKNKNNRKSRPKKIGDKTLIKDIDQKLHNLLLEMESNKGWKLPSSSRSTIASEDRTSAAADTTSFHTQLQLDSESDVVSSFSRLTMSNDRNAASEVDAIITLDSLFQQELESKMDSAPIKCCSPCLAVAVEKDVIDLSSPSPEQGPCNVSRCQGDAKRMDVIYLSDSDTEISPEHARKVRELRSFLASMREEIS